MPAGSGEGVGVGVVVVGTTEVGTTVVGITVVGLTVAVPVGVGVGEVVVGVGVGEEVWVGCGDDPLTSTTFPRYTVCPWVTVMVREKVWYPSFHTCTR